MSGLGPIALFGSGETAPGVQRIHHRVMEELSPPVRAAIVETPAGFEPNSEGVARKIGDYLEHRLQNFNPEIRLIPARRRSSSHDPDDPQIAEPIFTSNYLFMGPGSPTYAVRQLRDTFTWHALLLQHRRGAAICFSSATTLAVSRYTIPVYEIYKVGEDLHWKAGLDFFGAFGIPLAIVPHWNNNDGGDELDTSRCYMGEARYDRLVEMLPDRGIAILGIEENTGLVIRPEVDECQVIGAGAVVIIRQGEERRFSSRQRFPTSHLGDWRLPDPADGIPDQVLDAANAAQEESADHPEQKAPAKVVQLSQVREEARQRQDWQEADRIRDQIAEMGWQIVDTPDGPVLEEAE